MVKKYLLIIVLVFFTNLVISQNKITLGIDYYPNLSFQLKEKGEHSIGKFSNSIGINLSKRFKDRFELSLGVNYSNIGSRELLENLIFSIQPDGTLSSIIDSIDLETYYNYRSIEIPVKLRYNIKKGKNGFYSSIGIIASKNIGTNHYSIEISLSEKNGHKTPRTNLIDYSRINFDFQIGVGYLRQISDKYGIYLEPRIEGNSLYGKYNIHTTRGRFVSYGVGTGLIMKFNS